MKARGLFLSALMMSAVFAGCSNDDALNEEFSEKKNGQKESYMAINIVTSDVAGSRGAEGGFAAGSETENAVNDLILVFFKADGSHYDVQKRTDFTWEGPDAENDPGVIEKKSNVVVVFSEHEVKPASFVALLNTGKAESDFDGKSLADVQDVITDYATLTTIEDVDTTFFVMSNSVYSDGGVQVAAPITDDMICSTENAAKANPATAYVERVAAKLQATASASTTVEGKEVTLDGVKVTLTPTITGLKFIHTNPDSYLLKDITNVSADWSDATNFRSYWANSYAPEKYDIFSYNDAVKNGSSELTEYANENTSSTTTKLMVTATIDADADGTPVDIYKYKGYYYTNDGLKAEIASILKGKGLKYTIEGAEGDDWANYITVTHPDNVEQWEGTIVATESVTVTDEVKAEIAKLEKVRWWNKGKCYFYVDVEHFDGAVGVVRNHWYQLAVNSISGLGTPVADPEEPIDPERLEDETYYVAAQVQILKWKVVTQNVALQ